MREYLRSMLRKQPNITCCAEVSKNGAAGHAPDIILVDAPDAKEETLRGLLAEIPNCRIVVINSDPDDLNVIDCVGVGVVGFTLKNARSTDVGRTIRSVAADGITFPEAILRRLCEQVSNWRRRDSGLIPDVSREYSNLTNQERRIFGLLVLNKTNKEVSQELSIAEATVKAHVHSLLQKLGCRNRRDLIALYWKNRSG